MRSSRLLSILILLQTRGRMTAERLAAEFEVSVRTLYRDIDALSAAGVPVYADRGPGGGFALLDGYRTRLTGLTDQEAHTLILSGLPGPAAQLGLGQAMADAQLKVLAALPEGPGAAAVRAQARIHLDPVGWFRQADGGDWLTVLADGLWRDRRVRVRYGPRRPVDRVLEPLGLVLKAGAWYLIARSKGELRTYRASQVIAAEVTEDGFERPAGFDLAAHWTRAQADYAAGLKQGVARLKVSRDALYVLRRDGVEVTDLGGGIVETPMESLDWTARGLLRLGPGVEVLGPPALRTRIGRLAAEIAALYTI
ncbi:MAG: WYL domain-containing protein [Caulobacteraceae bacterium]|nr:MAG: WYL domain-containing protein [Caulobacteraceae bacterium]